MEADDGGDSDGDQRSNELGVRAGHSGGTHDRRAGIAATVAGEVLVLLPLDF